MVQAVVLLIMVNLCVLSVHIDKILSQVNTYCTFNI